MEKNSSTPVICLQTNDSGIGRKMGETMAVCAIMSVSLVGNLLVMLVFKRNPSSRTNINHFIVNMAASDLLLPFFVLPDKLVHIWLGSGRFLVGGQVGEFLCKFVPFMGNISVAVSVQSLILIAMERFIAVVYPTKAKKFTLRFRALLVLVMWIVAAVLYSPCFYFLTLVKICNSPYCTIGWSPLIDIQMAYKIYYTALVIILVYIPLPLIAVLYTSLSFKLRRKAPGSQVGETQDIRRHEQHRRIVNMCICIVIGFALCWLPVATYALIRHYSTLPVNSYLDSVLLHLYTVSGAVNPWILFYFCGNFRQGLRDMFRCCPCVAQGQQSSVVERNIELQERDRVEEN